MSSRLIDDQSYKKNLLRVFRGKFEENGRDEGCGRRKRCRGSFWDKLAELILEAHSTDRASIVNMKTPITLMGSAYLLIIIVIPQLGAAWTDAPRVR